MADHVVVAPKHRPEDLTAFEKQFGFVPTEKPGEVILTLEKRIVANEVRSVECEISGKETALRAFQEEGESKSGKALTETLGKAKEVQAELDALRSKLDMMRSLARAFDLHPPAQATR